MTDLLPHILLVGNDSAQAELLTTGLNALGLPLLGPATTAAQAQVLYGLVKPSLVVIDAALQPTPADTIELGRHLLQLGATPLIFLTETVSMAATIRKALLPQAVCVTKPYTAAYLQRVIQIVLAQSSLAEGITLPPLVVLDVVSEVVPSPHLFVRERSKWVRLEAALIVCVETEAKHCLLTIASGHRYTVRLPLRELLALLAPAHFVQTHRSWLVNIQYVEYINPSAGTIHLIGGLEVPLGRAHVTAFFKQLRFVD